MDSSFPDGLSPSARTTSQALACGVTVVLVPDAFTESSIWPGSRAVTLHRMVCLFSEESAESNVKGSVVLRIVFVERSTHSNVSTPCPTSAMTSIE